MPRPKGSEYPEGIRFMAEKGTKKRIRKLTRNASRFIRAAVLEKLAREEAAVSPKQ